MKKKELKERIEELKLAKEQADILINLFSKQIFGLKQELETLRSANHDMHRQLVELREKDQPKSHKDWIVSNECKKAMNEMHLDLISGKAPILEMEDKLREEFKQQFNDFMTKGYIKQPKQVIDTEINGNPV